MDHCLTDLEFVVNNFIVGFRDLRDNVNNPWNWEASQEDRVWAKHVWCK